MISLDIPAFESFCGSLMIPSRDSGLVPFTLWGTQRHVVREIAAGLERDVHDFVELKGGRQIGGSTTSDAITLWWEQSNSGTQGMLVSDDDDNRDYRRDVLMAMNASLPRELRVPMRMSNRMLAAWSNGSRLSFRAAGTRTGSNLGRSLGISFLHADEVGSWPDQQAISALRASLSQKNPERLYLWNSTARGIDTPFHDMWKTAEKAITQRAIFLAWWRHEGYRIEKAAQPELWKRYAGAALSSDERQWVNEVARRYKVVIEREQIAWYRWQLAEQFYGDEVLLAQEFSCLPEDAFQAFGEKFIPPMLVRALRLKLPHAPKPKGFTYEFLDTLDATAEGGVHDADPDDSALRVWEEPAPDGVYVVAGHPAYSSSEHAGTYVAEVFRVWPDKIVQVAEYLADSGAMYQFAWVLLHLCGAYRTFTPAYFILEVGVSGMRVLDEIQLLERHGYGLSPAAKGKVQDFLGSVRHYFYYRPDNVFTRSAPEHWKTHGNNRTWLLHGLRDTIERGQMEIRSPELIDALAALRRGEEGDSDVIAGAAKSSDSAVICAALGVKAWMGTAMPDLVGLVPPKEPDKLSPNTAGERLVKSYLGNLIRLGRA